MEFLLKHLFYKFHQPPPPYGFTFCLTSNEIFHIFHEFHEFPVQIFVSSTLIIQAQRLHLYRVYVVRCALQISRGQRFIAWLATLFLWAIKPQELHSVMSKETKRKRKSSLRPKNQRSLYSVCLQLPYIVYYIDIKPDLPLASWLIPIDSTN